MTPPWGFFQKKKCVGGFGLRKTHLVPPPRVSSLSESVAKDLSGSHPEDCLGPDNLTGPGNRQPVIAVCLDGGGGGGWTALVQNRPVDSLLDLRTGGVCLQPHSWNFLLTDTKRWIVYYPPEPVKNTLLFIFGMFFLGHKGKEEKRSFKNLHLGTHPRHAPRHGSRSH